MSSTTALYKFVIDDVIEKVQDEFINSGVDDHILTELRAVLIEISYKLLIVAVVVDGKTVEITRVGA